MIWDLIYLSSSLWTSASALFVGTPLSIKLLDWNLVSISTRLVEKILPTGMPPPMGSMKLNVLNASWVIQDSWGLEEHLRIIMEH